MSPQARRWQTAISRASDDDVRWSQFVDYLDSLEASAGGSPDPSTRPESLDGRYLQSRIDGMQAQIDRSERDRNPTLTPSPTTSGNAGEETQ